LNPRTRQISALRKPVFPALDHDYHVPFFLSIHHTNPSTPCFVLSSPADSLRALGALSDNCRGEQPDDSGVERLTAQETEMKPRIRSGSTDTVAIVVSVFRIEPSGTNPPVLWTNTATRSGNATAPISPTAAPAAHKRIPLHLTSRSRAGLVINLTLSGRPHVGALRWIACFNIDKTLRRRA